MCGGRDRVRATAWAWEGQGVDRGESTEIEEGKGLTSRRSRGGSVPVQRRSEGRGPLHSGRWWLTVRLCECVCVCEY